MDCCAIIVSQEVSFMARVFDFEKEKQKLIKKEIQKRGFSTLDMDKL